MRLRFRTDDTAEVIKRALALDSLEVRANEEKRDADAVYEAAREVGVSDASWQQALEELKQRRSRRFRMAFGVCAASCLAVGLVIGQALLPATDATLSEPPASAYEKYGPDVSLPYELETTPSPEYSLGHDVEVTVTNSAGVANEVSISASTHGNRTNHNTRHGSVSGSRLRLPKF